MRNLPKRAILGGCLLIAGYSGWAKCHAQEVDCSRDPLPFLAASTLGLMASPLGNGHFFSASALITARAKPEPKEESLMNAAEVLVRQLGHKNRYVAEQAANALEAMGPSAGKSLANHINRERLKLHDPKKCEAAAKSIKLAANILARIGSIISEEKDVREALLAAATNRTNAICENNCAEHLLEMRVTAIDAIGRLNAHRGSSLNMPKEANSLLKLAKERLPDAIDYAGKLDDSSKQLVKQLLKDVKKEFYVVGEDKRELLKSNKASIIFTVKNSKIERVSIDPSSKGIDAKQVDDYHAVVSVVESDKIDQDNKYKVTIEGKDQKLIVTVTIRAEQEKTPKKEEEMAVSPLDSLFKFANDLGNARAKERAAIPQSDQSPTSVGSLLRQLELLPLLQSIYVNYAIAKDDEDRPEEKPRLSKRVEAAFDMAADVRRLSQQLKSLCADLSHLKKEQDALIGVISQLSFLTEDKSAVIRAAAAAAQQRILSARE